VFAFPSHAQQSPIKQLPEYLVLAVCTEADHKYQGMFGWTKAEALKERVKRPIGTGGTF
jgi:hypothetical protein